MQPTSGYDSEFKDIPATPWDDLELAALLLTSRGSLIDTYMAYARQTGHGHLTLEAWDPTKHSPRRVFAEPRMVVLSSTAAG